MKYQIQRLSQVVEVLGIEQLNYITLGKGNFVVMEYDHKVGWFPLCGENRFKTKHEANQAIKDREFLDWELSRFKPKSIYGSIWERALIVIEWVAEKVS